MVLARVRFPGRANLKEEDRTMDDFDKKLHRNINAVKRGINNLRALDLKIEIQETETMVGTLVNHIYVTDTICGRVCLQKHLFTV